MHQAIYGYSGCGPGFGIGHGATFVSNISHANTENETRYPREMYTNHTGLGGSMGSSTFLTGLQFFKVIEIEIFEIRSYTTLPINPNSRHIADTIVRFFDEIPSENLR
jgi:hypothetical protein